MNNAQINVDELAGRELDAAQRNPPHPTAEGREYWRQQAENVEHGPHESDGFRAQALMTAVEFYERAGETGSAQRCWRESGRLQDEFIRSLGDDKPNTISIYAYSAGWCYYHGADYAARRMLEYQEKPWLLALARERLEELAEALAVLGLVVTTGHN